MAMGEVQVAAREGHKVPIGTGLNKDGKETTDPNEIAKGGVILPFGGYKGSGIAMMVELLAGALLGDFVIAIFNPQSLERNWQLKRAIELCLGYRPGNTPVLVGRQVGRENQSKSFFSLDSMPLKDIDMLSIIIIGNSKTTLVDEIFLTPRGYLKK